MPAYEFKCPECKNVSLIACPVDERDSFLLYCGCGVLMRRQFSVPQLITMRTVYRYESQFMPGASDKDKLEKMKADEAQNAKSWEPNYDAQDEALGGTPVF
jgi:transcription elongation factor Elf1